MSGEKKGRNRSCRVAVDSIAYHLMQGESLIKFSTLDPFPGGGSGMEEGVPIQERHFNSGSQS